MKKNTYSKALYHFAKKQKNKDSTSTKDLNDSLDGIQLNDSHSEKKTHQRTQSCPSVSLVPITSFPEIKIDPINQ